MKNLKFAILMVGLSVTVFGQTVYGQSGTQITFKLPDDTHTSGDTNREPRASWWILAKRNGGYAEDLIPRAIGPYPSQELCRIAGHDLARDDRRFWTAEERAKAEEADRKEAEAWRLKQERHSKEILPFAEAVRAGKIKPGKIKLPSGDDAYLDKNGTENTIIFSGTSSGFLPMMSYTALTPCVEIKAEAAK